MRFMKLQNEKVDSVSQCCMRRGPEIERPDLKRYLTIYSII